MKDEFQFDVSKFTAELVQKNVVGIFEATKALFSKTASKIEAKLKSSYKTYILNAAEHYGMSKTFFTRESRFPLYNYYVPLELKSRSSRFPKASIARIATAGTRVLIVGNAGCGKSTLMRHFFLDSIRDGNRIPIFVELNKLGEYGGVDLWQQIYNSCKRHKLKLNENQIAASVKTGRFTLLFDGLDEVEDSIRNETVRAIEVLSGEVNNCLIIVSSRPDYSLSAFRGFNHYRVQPLSRGKAVDLVQKLPFDEDLRAKFAQELAKSLYDRHKSFLSNPLLLSIMLLTFGQSASIPNRLSVFYNQAYEALFQTHDALKGGYSRKRYTTLDIQEFEEVFAAFCLVSFDSSKYRFSKIECLEMLEKAQAISQVEFEPFAMLKDCLSSVNLLMEDGLELTFVHRSFQEYFAARCVGKLSADKKRQLLDRISARGDARTFLRLCWEIDRQPVEDLWLVPQIEVLRKVMKVKKNVGITHYFRYVKSFVSEVESFAPLDFRLRLGFLPGKSSLKEAIFLVYLCYFKPRIEGVTFDQEVDRLVGAALQKTDGVLDAKTLTARSSELKLLSRQSRGILANSFVQALVDLPAQIQAEREKASDSLDEILGLE